MNRFAAVVILILVTNLHGYTQTAEKTFLKEKKAAPKQFLQMKTDSLGKKYKKTTSVPSRKDTLQLPVPEPVAEYLFGGNANDTSGNSHHAQVRGAVLTEDKLGQENNAYIFYERSHSVRIPLPTFASGSFTVSFWVKTKQRSSVLKSIMANEGSASSKWGFNYSSDGRIHFHLRNQSNASAFITHPIGDDKWHQITGVRNAENNTMSLYADGRLVQTQEGVTGDLNNGNDIWVGDGANRLFVGRIDDIKLWNTALSQRDLETIHKKEPVAPIYSTNHLSVQTSAIPISVGAYMFSGNADDSSENANHGLVYGAELTEDRVGNENQAFLFYSRPHRIKIPKTALNTFSSGNFSVSFWVKSVVTPFAVNSLVTNDAGSSPYWGFQYTTQNKILFRVRNQEGDSAFIQYLMNDGKWHHILGTRNAQNNTISLYVDAIHVETRAGVTGSVDSTGPIWVGDHQNRLFIGRIDDVVLWDKSFNDMQAKNDYTMSLNSLTYTPSEPEPAVNEPVGNYSFNGNAVDESTQNNDGIVTNAQLSPDRFGNQNSAYSFSHRDSKIKIPLIPANTFSKGSFTVVFWVKLDALPLSMLPIITNSNNKSHHWSFNCTNKGELVFSLKNKENQFCFIKHSLTVGQWYKITGIRNAENNTASLYVGSQHIATKQGVTGDVNTADSIWVGDHTNRLFRGSIDDLVLWRKSFTQSEIRQMNSVNLQQTVPQNNIQIYKNLNKKLPKY
jgi:Concanavalin A-like lectin/glucanases superfamily